SEQVADDKHRNGAVGGNHQWPEHSSFGEDPVIPFLSGEGEAVFLEMRTSVWYGTGTSLRSGNPDLHPLGRNDFRFAPAPTFEPVARFLEDLHERPLLLRGVQKSRDGVLDVPARFRFCVSAG